MSDDDIRIEEARRRKLWHDAFLSGDLGSILQALYDQEINVGMQSFWDGGWTVWLGLGEPWVAQKQAEATFDRDSFDEIAGWLRETAETHYPALKAGRTAVMDAYG